MVEKIHELKQEQKEFLELVLKSVPTRWPVRIKRIIETGQYGELDRLKMNEVRIEYINYIRK